MNNIEQVLSKKCSTHPDYCCDILFLDTSSDQHRVCTKCIIEKKLFEKIIPIKELLSIDPSSKKPVYPIVEGSELQDMLQVESNIDKLCTKIEDYYLKLQIKIKQAISKKLQTDCERMKQQITEWKLSNNKLQELLTIKTFQDLLQSQDNNQEEKLHAYIVKRTAQVEREMQIIRKSFFKIKDFQSTFSTELPLVTESEILKQIQALDIFAQVPKQIIQQQAQLPQQVEQINILGNLHCLSSKIKDSQTKLKIEKINNQIQITNISYKQDSAQFYLLPELEKNKNYIIQLTLNNKYEDKAWFDIGLLDSLHKDDWWVSGCGDDANYSQKHGGFCTTVVKGKQLHSNDAKRVGLKKLELRINLSKKIFKLSSLPSYENVAELNDKSFIKEKSYVLAMMIYNSGDQITIEQIVEVNFFNSSM